MKKLLASFLATLALFSLASCTANTFPTMPWNRPPTATANVSSPQPSDGNPNADHSFSFVTYNIRTTTQDSWDSHGNRGAAIVNYLKGFDLIVLEEVRNQYEGGKNAWTSLKSGLTGFGYEHGSQTPKTPYYDTAVFWRTATFERTDGGRYLTFPKRDHYNEQRPLAWAKLRDKATGKSFVVVAAHPTPGGYPDEQRAENKRMLDFLSRKFGSDTPVVLAGDMNYPALDGPNKLLLDAGYQSGYNIAANKTNLDYGTWAKDGKIGNPPEKQGDQYDHIFVRGGVTIPAMTIRIDMKKSDHLPLEATLALPRQ